MEIGWISPLPGFETGGPTDKILTDLPLAGIFSPDLINKDYGQARKELEPDSKQKCLKKVEEM